MRILVAEDEPRMGALIRQGLEEETYAVDVVEHGDDVLPWLRTGGYDLVLLDVMLPGTDGFAVCRQMRDQGYRMPVLMLTARDAISDRVQGLDSGADDYLVKPFGMPELTARVRALLRRPGARRPVELTAGDLILDTSARRARRGVREVEALTAKEYAILEVLMRHAGQVVTRDQIIEHVWNLDFDSESKLVEVYIHSLRRKTEAGGEPRLIETIRGMGYRMGGA